MKKLLLPVFVLLTPFIFISCPPSSETSPSYSTLTFTLKDMAMGNTHYVYALLGNKSNPNPVAIGKSNTVISGGEAEITSYMQMQDLSQVWRAETGKTYVYALVIDMNNDGNIGNRGDYHYQPAEPLSTKTDVAIPAFGYEFEMIY